MIKKYLYLFLLAVALLNQVPTTTFATQTTTKEYHLKNGLTLLVKPDHRAPVGIFQIWYKVGSSYETNGNTGLSHILEHLMFKGTKKYPNDTFSQLIAQNGGNENAATSADYTFYYQEVTKKNLELSFKLEADRMRHLTLNPTDVKKELEVIKEERRLRTEDSPTNKTYEHFLATAFLSSGYHNPVIGWMNDISNTTLNDVMTWYNQWYYPNHAIIVIVGDVQPNTIYKLAQKYFGSIPRGPKIIEKKRVEPKPLGTKRIQVNLPAKVPYILMGYLTPSLKTATKQWEPYALLLLSQILSANNSARFPKHLVRDKKLALNAGAFYSMLARNNKLFVIYGVPAENVSLNQLEQAFLKEIHTIQNTLVPQKELQRIKNALIAETIYEKDSLSAQASALGRLAVVGLPWQLDAQFITDIKQITPQQIQDVAKTYLIPNRLTIAELHPQTLQSIPHHSKPKRAT